MSSFLNRLKNLKTGSISSNNNEGDTTSICSFDEEGFLCPVCHRKFADTTGLEYHYSQAHSQPSAISAYENTNGNQHASRHEPIDDSMQEATMWKEQFLSSEESRMSLSNELIQQKQRVGDLEDELAFVQKQLHATQMKVIEQSKEIGELKATNDVYDAQFAIFTDELLSTQGELKEKQNQVVTLCNDLIPRPTTDDVDVLKHELISVQQRMNDLSLEKEQEMEQLRHVLHNNYESIEQCQQTLDQNAVIYKEIIDQQASEIASELYSIKPLLHSIRERKQAIETTCKSMRTNLDETRKEIEQLKQTNAQFDFDLEHQIQSNEQLTNDLQNECKQNNAQRIQIDALTNEIQELEKSLDELKQDKNRYLLTKMNDEQDDERQNLLQLLTHDKNQYEQQVKDLRKQAKQINEEKNQLQDDYNTLQQQLHHVNREKEQQINALRDELSVTREEHDRVRGKLDNDLREVNETMEREKHEQERIQDELKDTNQRLTEEVEQLKHSLNQQEELLSETQSQLQTIQTEKYDLDQQLKQTIEELQNNIAQLQTDIDHKESLIDRLSAGIRRRIDVAQKVMEYAQQTIHPSQINLLDMLTQSSEESQTSRTQIFEDIRTEFTHYLTVIQTVINDKKIQLEKQTEDNELKLLEKQQQLNEIKHQYDEQTHKLETQLTELNHKLLQVSECLSQTTQLGDLQREKSEKQITSLEEELAAVRTDVESRTKKYEMQLSALTENLATVRAEVKIAQEKLVNFEQVKAEKADLETRLVANQDERLVLIERALTGENKNDKLLRENDELTKKNSDLESALKEIAREYQGLQIHSNTISERRWLNDTNVHECMKCNQTFTLTQRKHHCRSCGNIFCEKCSSKTAIVAAASKKPQRVCDQCFKDLTS